MRKNNCVIMLLLVVFVVIGFVFNQMDVTSYNDCEVIEDEQTSLDDEVLVGKNDDVKHNDIKPVYLSDVLFIGDSRTVGLMEYSKIDEPTYFCNVGMSVFNIHNKKVSVPHVGKVTLLELLNNKQYKRIYIMLGLNELGYRFDQIVNKYQELLNFVKYKQKDAQIVILGNLHLTDELSQKDKLINNNRINKLNAALARFANNNDIFYLDTNALCDVNGALDKRKSSDGTHLYAKYYREWGRWILDQTAINEG